MIIRITSRPVAKASSTSLQIEPLRLAVPSRPLRILDFDVEARPLHWISGDFVSKEITAIAWKFIGEPGPVSCYLLGEVEPEDFLRAFLHAYTQADIVTGHYIRGYDVPMVQGALMEYRLPVLPDKLTHDTKLDLVRRAGLSMSQESLGAMLRLDHQKVTMNQAKWRAANRLQPEGLAHVRERVTGDVEQHIEMREELLALGYLSAPKLWKSGSAPVEPYSP